MTTDNLPQTENEDDLLLQVEQFKMGLVARATGGDFEAKEYSRFRKLILTNPNLEKVIPRFLQLCRTSDEFWGWIKAAAPSYAERRVIIATEINPILEILEYENGEGALEFSKNYEALNNVMALLKKSTFNIDSLEALLSQLYEIKNNENVFHGYKNRATK